MTVTIDGRSNSAAGARVSSRFAAVLRAGNDERAMAIRPCREPEVEIGCLEHRELSQLLPER